MRFILGIIVGILSLIFIVQNPDPVRINFLAWFIEISKSIVVLISLAFGIILGWTLRGAGIRRRRVR